jgi:hypothetical protein
VYGEACGSAPRAQGIDAIEDLRERVGNAATIRNNRDMLARVEESFRRHLHYRIQNNGGYFERFVK